MQYCAITVLKAIILDSLQLCVGFVEVFELCNFFPLFRLICRKIQSPCTSTLADFVNLKDESAR